MQGPRTLVPPPYLGPCYHHHILHANSLKSTIFCTNWDLQTTVVYFLMVHYLIDIMNNQQNAYQRNIFYLMYNRLFSIYNLVIVPGGQDTDWPRHQWQVTPASSLWSQFSWPNPLKGHRARDLSLPEHSTLSIRIGPVPSPKWALVKAAADLIWNINTKCTLRNSNSVYRYMYILIKWLDSKIQIIVAILNIWTWYEICILPCGVPQSTTNHTCVIVVPTVVTHRPPVVANFDLYPPFSTGTSSNQSYVN